MDKEKKGLPKLTKIKFDRGIMNHFAAPKSQLGFAIYLDFDGTLFVGATK